MWMRLRVSQFTVIVLYLPSSLFFSSILILLMPHASSTVGSWLCWRSWRNMSFCCEQAPWCATPYLSAEVWWFYHGVCIMLPDTADWKKVKEEKKKKKKRDCWGLLSREIGGVQEQNQETWSWASQASPMSVCQCITGADGRIAGKRWALCPQGQLSPSKDRSHTGR